MTEGAVLVLRLLLWLLPGLLMFLAVRGFLAGRPRLALGFLVGGVLAALLVKPFPVGFAFWLIGGLAGLGGGRNPRYARELRERIEEQRR
ncbi:MAG: hypothetical protein RMK51_07565 [Meiothermus sp.]|uniref:hypothetical protein n=1 Tax=Meiothermus sp. TaxID=1955249 RepID=UPI0025ECC4A1|nr:hypothetical protein [Meiothermus sp.]MCS7069209.1 hypothetical protein [Meiothermus sp.]MDW8425775.1 hypothetical protein [Meiothermus sp.]